MVVMSSKDIKTEVIDKMFTKGFVAGKSNNKKPDYLANTARNVRIKFGGLSPRLGFEQLYEGTGNKPQGIQGTNGELLYVHGGDLKKLNLVTNVPTTIGTLTGLGGTQKVSFVRYGKYTIILTGIGYPRVYDGATLTQLGATEITSGDNPSFGAQFAGFTVVNTTSNAKNIIKFSKPIGLTTQTNAYDWDLTGGSESVSYDTQVIGLESSMNFLWVFTKDKVEKFTKDSVSTTGGIVSLFSVPVARGYEALNNDCIVSAGDFVLFVTKKMQIATIEYVQSNQTDPQFAVISNKTESGLDIQDVLDGLDEDQTDSFGIFDRKGNCVKWSFKTNGSPVNDIWIVYDITNNTRYTDDNKLFSCICELDNELYAGGAFSGDIFHDEYGKNDINEGIDWEYEVDMIVSNQYRKKYMGAYLGGSINYLAKIKRDIEVDEQLEFTDQVNGSDYAQDNITLGIGGHTLGYIPIGGDVLSIGEEKNSFKARVTESRLAGKGITLTHRRYGNEIDQDFTLDYLDISYKPLRTTELSQKF